MKIYSVIERIDADCSFVYKPIMFFYDRSLAEKQCEILLDDEPWMRGHGHISDGYTVDEFVIMESVYIPEKKERESRTAQSEQTVRRLDPPGENEIRVEIQSNMSRAAYNAQKTETLNQIIEMTGFSDYAHKDGVHVSVCGCVFSDDELNKPISDIAGGASSLWIVVCKADKNA